jgi:phosphatidylglycerol lysyltransferase
LIGFALIISAINIFKRKRRAWQLVLLLACLSVTLHLTRGLDYAAAGFSLLLVIVLILTRAWFTVKSRVPDPRWALIRVLLAGLVALSYGVAGFRLLDQGDFGVAFTFGDAVRQTLRFLSLAGDARLIPRTHYAEWFLNSLYLLALTAISYAGFALFRPAIYQFRTLPRERGLATKLVVEYGRSALDYFKLWPDKSYFFSASQRCFLAYRVGGNFAVVLGDPVGPEKEMEEVIRRFIGMCRENDWGFGFYQTLPDFLPIYSRAGLRKLKIGDAAIVDLTSFSAQSKAARDFRKKVHQLEEAGIEIKRYEPPLHEEVVRQARDVSDQWLQIPGRRERGFSLGRFEPEYLRSTTLYTVCGRNGRFLAFVNLIPSFRRGEATADLMRRRPDAPNGIMDYLFVKLLLDVQARGFDRFNLGMAPMAGFQEKEEASREERAVHFFFQHLNFLFSFRGIFHYKAKYASVWEPRYAIYNHVLDLPRLGLALREVSKLDE